MTLDPLHPIISHITQHHLTHTRACLDPSILFFLLLTFDGLRWRGNRRFQKKMRLMGILSISFKFKNKLILNSPKLPTPKKRHLSLFPLITLLIYQSSISLHCSWIRKMIIMEKLIMEDCARIMSRWSNKELKLISRQRARVREVEQQAMRRGILQKDTNNLDFYHITPKEELPKFLQKMRFQTLHLKEKDITSSIKVFRKENCRPEEKILRKKLREEGHIMLLSEIYQHLGETGEIKCPTTHNVKPEPVPDLEEWEKQRKQGLQAGHPGKAKVEEGRQSQVLPKQFRLGADYKGEIERSLGIIQVTHASEFNLMNRYQLVENSSKLLKRELDEKKAQVEESIKSKMKQLYEARTEYHNFFEEKNRLKLEERMHCQEFTKELTKEDSFRISHKSISNIRMDKNSQQRLQKRTLMEANELKIQRAKSSIAALEEAIGEQQEELRKMMVAEKLYYKISLRNGNDVRENGLVWIIKLLQIKEQDMNHYEYPQFLDRRCRIFLIQKAASEEQEELLLQQKRKFVNQIGRASSESKFKYKSIMSPKELMVGDRVIQNDLNSQSVPKKYRRSLKKITQLNEEYIKNSSLLEVRERNKVMQISADLEGLSNKQIYGQIGERIKRLDLSKMKKDKVGSKKLKLLQYQSLLEKIKNIHIKLQEMDLQMQNYLLTHYKDNRNLYFMQAAACFGYKRAYSMIIKHFSWKTYHENS